MNKKFVITSKKLFLFTLIYSIISVIILPVLLGLSGVIILQIALPFFIFLTILSALNLLWKKPLVFVDWRHVVVTLVLHVAWLTPIGTFFLASWLVFLYPISAIGTVLAARSIPTAEIVPEKVSDTNVKI